MSLRETKSLRQEEGEKKREEKKRRPLIIYDNMAMASHLGLRHVEPSTIEPRLNEDSR